MINKSPDSYNLNYDKEVWQLQLETKFIRRLPKISQAPNTAFTLKTPLRHYAKRALTLGY